MIALAVIAVLIVVTVGLFIKMYRRNDEIFGLAGLTVAMIGAMVTMGYVGINSV